MTNLDDMGLPVAASRGSQRGPQSSLSQVSALLQPGRTSWHPTPRALLFPGVVAFSILLQWRWLTLFTDVRFTLGALRAGGLPAVDIFVHRPMANRLLMSVLDHMTFGPVVVRERLTLSLAIAFAGLACAGLAAALRGWIAEPPAICVGLAIFAALAWGPDTTVLQPEWSAIVLSVAGLGLTLRRGSTRLPSWHSPLLVGAGLLLALATLQKYTTITTALLAWGVAFVIDRRRAWFVGSWTFLMTAGLFGLTILWPHERQWFRDMPRLNQTAVTDWPTLARSLWGAAWDNPVLMLWPAAIIVGLALSRRRIWLVGSLLAVLVVMAGTLVQNAYYPYHYAALPVLAAGLVSLAAVHWWQRTATIWHPTVLGCGWLLLAAWMGRQSFAWRTVHHGPAVVGVVVTLLTCTSLALWQVRRLRTLTRGRRPPPWKLGCTLAALALVLSFPAWPHTPYGFAAYDMSRVSEVARRAGMIEQGRQIRNAARGVEVAYVTRQEAPYFTGLPTDCAYPVAVFLYRSTMHGVEDLSSFEENLDCLRDPTAEFVVLQPVAASSKQAAQSVRETLEKQFDCRHRIVRTPSLMLCPRRPPTR